MAFASDLTKLADTDLVDDDDQARLRAIGILSVEELIDAITASPESVARVLHRPVDTVESLRDRAFGLLDEATQSWLSQPRTKYATGALPPLGRSSGRAKRARGKHQPG